LIKSSPRLGTPHIIWSDDVFRKGQQINMETSGERFNYFAPLMRSYSIGKPSDRLLRMHDTQAAGIEAGLHGIRPGRTCGDVADDIYRAIEKQGLQTDSRAG